MSQTNLVALQAAVKLLADVATDVSKGGSVVGYTNLLPDVMLLATQIGDIPIEAKALQPEDYQTLLTSLVTDLALPAGKAENVAVAALQVLNTVLPLAKSVEALVAVVKAP